MSRRDGWNRVLESEVARWLEMSCDQLIAELSKVQAYRVEVDEKQFQVEVELLENTSDYIHVIVAVDDGSLPWSISPVTRTFIKKKNV